MPREDRRISFENEEVYKALFALCTQKQLKKPPAGRISKVTELNQNIIIDIENALEGKSGREEYTADFVAAALMLYCRGCGIPLPKSARKSVVIDGGIVTLRVQI